MPAPLQYHHRVAKDVGQGLRIGAWAGLIVGAIAAVVAASAMAPAAALLTAPLTAAIGMGGGAIVGMGAGMLYGVIRHSALFARAQVEKDHIDDIANLQRRIQESLVPEPSLPGITSGGTRFQDRLQQESLDIAANRQR